MERKNGERERERERERKLALQSCIFGLCAESELQYSVIYNLGEVQMSKPCH
jgi:hypothetical protein